VKDNLPASRLGRLEINPQPLEAGLVGSESLANSLPAGDEQRGWADRLLPLSDHWEAAGQEKKYEWNPEEFAKGSPDWFIIISGDWESGKQPIRD
jgi:hypothetical protein